MFNSFEENLNMMRLYFKTTAIQIAKINICVGFTGVIPKIRMDFKQKKNPISFITF